MSSELALNTLGAHGSRWKRYPAYKDSGVEWLGEVPEGWETWKITHGFQQVGSGTTPKSDDMQYYNGKIPWVTTSELRETVITNTKSKLAEKALNDYSSLHIYPLGTLLFAMYGATIGRMGILGIPATVNQACCAFTDPKFLDPKFTFYWLWMRRPILITLSVGGGQPNLSQDDLRNIKIPVPSLLEQCAIATFLDRETGCIDTLIEKKERQIELLREKRAALMSHVVTKGLDTNFKMKDSGVEWLGEVPEHWSIGRAKLLFQEINDRSTTGDETLLTVSHISGVTRRSEKNVNMFMAESLEGYKICEAGDLVINTMWAWMGAMGIASERGIVSPSYNVYRFRTKDNELSFYGYLFKTGQFISEVICHSKGIWSSRLRLYPESFFEIQIPFPPQEEQRGIVSLIQKETGNYEILQQKIEKSIFKLREYRIALISAAVTGKIDIRKDLVS